MRQHRRSTRLQAYDYSQAGAYFVTICTEGRVCLFGGVVDTDVHLNAAGRMAVDFWERIPERFRTAEIDTFVVMPNHLHGIVVLHERDGGAALAAAPERHGVGNVGAALVAARSGATTRVAPTAARSRATTRVAPTIGDIIGAFKSETTVAYIRSVRENGWPTFRGRLWQRNFYEHVIRNESALTHIREYVANNPARWAEDPDNPAVCNAAVDQMRAGPA